jgi:excinuclease ABC subunit A
MKSQKDFKLTDIKFMNIEIVVDRILVRETARSRIRDSVDVALNYGNGIVIINDGKKDHVYSRHLACLDCGVSYSELAPNSFSFNSPYGSCPDCEGLGEKKELDLNLIIPDWNKSINEEGLSPLGKPRSIWFFTQLEAVAKKFTDLIFDTPL